MGLAIYDCCKTKQEAENKRKELVQPENAKLQRPIIVAERERCCKAIEKAFERIVAEDIAKLRR